MDPLNKTYVELTEQPNGKGLRFRYISEGRTAGSIQGEHSSNEHRTFPSIKIHNYSGPAVAVVSCVTTDKPPRPHPHHLVGTNCHKGVCTVHITGSSDPIPFANIGIQCCTRKDIAKNLEERRLMNIDSFQTGFPVNVDSIDLTTVCLCFQVYLNVDGKMVGLNPVVSNPIVDKKVCSELSIYRLSRISGSVRGGDEVFLLCSKVKKEDIKVVFFHQLANGDSWEKEGSFSSTDVHKQYVVVFKTPPYCEMDIKQPVEVSLYLMRPSDNAAGEAKTFTYYPENPDPFGIKAKRKKMAETNPTYINQDFKPPFALPSGLASLTSSQPVSFPRFTGLTEGPGKWKFPGLSSSVTRAIPPVKPEVPGFPMTGMNMTGMNMTGRNFNSSPRNVYSQSGIPVTVEEGAGQMLPLLSVSKESGYNQVCQPFHKASTSSALELLFSGTGTQMMTTGTSAAAAFIPCSASLSSRPYVFNPASLNLSTSSMVLAAREPPAMQSVSAASTSGFPTVSATEFPADDLGVASMPAQTADHAALRDIIDDDILRTFMSSEEQNFLLNGIEDLTNWTDEELRSLQDLSFEFPQ